MNMNPTVAVLLLLSNAILAVLIVRNAERFARIVRSGWKQAYGILHPPVAASALAVGRSNGLNAVEKLTLAFIDRSNIRHYIPFMSIYVLMAFILLVFFMILKPLYSMLDFLPSTIMISAIISMVPLFALDLLAKYNSESIRKRLSEYISILNRWCSVKEDLMYAFEKSLEADIGEPLHSFVRDMVTQVSRGMDAGEALEMLQLKVDNPQFRDFILNVKLSMRHRGELNKLLTNLENQFYRIDEEYNRRSISTYRDRLLIYFIMFAVLLIAYFSITFTPQIGAYYLGTVQGKLLLTVFCGMYAAGFYLTTGITRFRY